MAADLKKTPKHQRYTAQQIEWHNVISKLMKEGSVQEVLAETKRLKLLPLDKDRALGHDEVFFKLLWGYRTAIGIFPTVSRGPSSDVKVFWLKALSFINAFTYRFPIAMSVRMQHKQYEKNPKFFFHYQKVPRDIRNLPAYDPLTCVFMRAFSIYKLTVKDSSKEEAKEDRLSMYQAIANLVETFASMGWGQEMLASGITIQHIKKALGEYYEWYPGIKETRLALTENLIRGAMLYEADPHAQDPIYSGKVFNLLKVLSLPQIATKEKEGEAPSAATAEKIFPGTAFPTEVNKLVAEYLFFPLYTAKEGKGKAKAKSKADAKSQPLTSPLPEGREKDEEFDLSPKAPGPAPSRTPLG